VRAFCEFNIETGQLKQRGRCGEQCIPRMRNGNAIAFVSISSAADTITFAEIDSGVAIDPVVHKASEAEKAIQRNRRLEPRRVFPDYNSDDIPAVITNKQWRDMNTDITNLKANKIEMS